MIKGKEKEKLDKETILSKIDDYNIIRFYLGRDFNFKKKYPSPFRGKVDKNPNLSFFMSNGKILYKDFANGRSGDCFSFVQELYNLSFKETLRRIDADLCLGINSKPKKVFSLQLKEKPDSIHKQSKIIQITKKPFTPEELKYWEDYQISEQDLIRKNVFSIEKLYINKQLVPNYNKEIRFAYLFDNYLKIYSPLSKVYKWISSTPNDYMSGFDEIKFKVFLGSQDEKLIISKSVKDEMILSKFFKDVCSTQNESKEAINRENMEWILRGYKPENVYISYDSDDAGVEASTYYTKNYGFNYVNVPKIFKREGIKDWADLVKHKGLDTMENYLKIKKLI